MAKKGKYVTYNLKQGRKVVYKGITNNPRRRLEEHEDSGKRFTHMNITSRRMTKQRADRKEDRELAMFRRTHKGRNPKYNKDNDG